MVVPPSASYSFTVRLQIANRPGMLGRVASAIGGAGGDIGAVDLVESTRERIVRDITIKARDSVHGQQIVSRLRRVAGVRVGHISDRTFLMHLGRQDRDPQQGSDPHPRRPLDGLHPRASPACAWPSGTTAQRAFSLTIKHNTVAVVTDGTAVLGLGDIGPEAALPVMEGKAMLFKEFAGVDAFPICLGTKDVDKIVETVKLVSPAFGGINLEDIARAPVLRGRGAAPEGAGHSRLPRRPARDGRRRAGGPAQRPEDRPQGRSAASAWS